MTTDMKQLEIVASVDRVVATLRSDFSEAMRERTQHDTEVDRLDWSFYPHLMWEDGWSTGADLPGVFVHMSARSFTEVDGTGIKPAGPDLMVGFCLRSHRDRLGSAMRVGSYAIEVLWRIAEDLGYRPHVRQLASFGRPESTDWAVNGTVVFGPIDGAAGEWL